jgi:hypothetical protein
METMLDQYPIETTGYSLDRDAPAAGERRDDKRHLTLFRVGALTIEGRRELCLIKNISSGGMRIRPYCDLAEGARVTVELKTGMSVPGSVVWTEDSTVGIAFDQPVDVIDVLSASDDGPRPRMPRVEVRCTATLRDGASIHQFAVRDVSQGGVKLEGDLPVALDCDVVVSLPGLAPRAGVVRWSADGNVGVTFNRLLSLAELVEWLKSVRESDKAA